nr:MAG TPA: hypothetical protein [Caudoviricetes sp.]
MGLRRRRSVTVVGVRLLARNVRLRSVPRRRRRVIVRLRRARLGWLGRRRLVLLLSKPLDKAAPWSLSRWSPMVRPVRFLCRRMRTRWSPRGGASTRPVRL